MELWSRRWYFPHSASTLLPASGPHREEGGLLRQAGTFSGQLRVPGYCGLLQGGSRMCVKASVWLISLFVLVFQVAADVQQMLEKGLC